MQNAVDTARNEPREPASPAALLTLQLLGWLTARPRLYAETMEAWRSTCPRLAIWEDALDDELVALQSGEAHGMSTARVVLTDRGRTLLAAGERIAVSTERRRA